MGERTAALQQQNTRNRQEAGTEWAQVPPGGRVGPRRLEDGTYRGFGKR